MPRAPLPPDLRARVVRAVTENGLSMSAAAAQFGVSKPTVRRWIDEYKAAPPSAPAPALEPRPPSTPPPPPAPPAVEDVSALGVARETAAALQQQIRDATRVGNHELAARLQGQLVKTLPQLKALEKGAEGDKDGVRYSRADIARGFEGVLAKAAAYRERGLRCADCGRALAMKLAGVDAAKLAEAGQPDQVAKHVEALQSVTRRS